MVAAMENFFPIPHFVHHTRMWTTSIFYPQMRVGQFLDAFNAHVNPLSPVLYA